MVTAVAVVAGRARSKGRKCICDPLAVVAKITGLPPPVLQREINEIRLNLFTERNSDGTGHLVLRGKDIHDRYGFVVRNVVHFDVFRSARCKHLHFTQFNMCRAEHVKVNYIATQPRRIDDRDIYAICHYVKEARRRIVRLDVCYNRITDVGFFMLLKKCLVKGRSGIINLNIMHNEITEVSIKNLAKYAVFVRLKYLRINGNLIGTKGGEHFAEFLHSNTTLEYADIGQSDQSLSSVAHLLTALRYNHSANRWLKVLDMNRVVPLFNRYQYETKWLVYHLELLLMHNETIVELHLQKNELTGPDAEYLQRGLRRNATLLYLDLGCNRLGDRGAELLAPAVAASPLRLLDLSTNGITDLGARALSLNLPFSEVRALDVAHNRMTDEGVLDLLNTIKKPSFMRFLNLWGNRLGHAACSVLDRMMLSGVLFQHTTDVRVYEVDGVFCAAYYPNPADRNKHLYYCELEYGVAQDIVRIKRNRRERRDRPVKVDCKHRHKLDKTDRDNF